MQNKINLQDNFHPHPPGQAERNGLFDERLPTPGVIAGFDPFVVVLMTDNKQQVIYKHAISTIVPERALELEAAVD